MSNKLFCFGFGYTADYLVRALMASDEEWTFAGTTRDPEKRAHLQARGIKASLYDDDRPLANPDKDLKGITHILISTPPDDHGGPTFENHAKDILRIPTLKWIGYLSSTSVYGDRNGGWVTEESEVRPTSKRGSRRARAEAEWMSLFEKEDAPIHLFRLSGIYGPNRSSLDSVRAGAARRIDKLGHAFNRIHVEDIVQCLAASMNNPKPGNAYNLADDMPSPSHMLISYACDLFGLQPPPLIPYEEADMAPIARSFYADNKRVKNDKIKDDLGVTLKYPNYMEGLDACLEEEADHNQIPDIFGI